MNRNYTDALQLKSASDSEILLRSRRRREGRGGGSVDGWSVHLCCQRCILHIDEGLKRRDTQSEGVKRDNVRMKEGVEKKRRRDKDG